MQYALDVVGDYIFGSGSSSTSAGNGTASILSLLRRYESTMQHFNADPNGTELPRAVYAAEHLQSYVKGEPCGTANMNMATFAKLVPTLMSRTKEASRDSF